MPSNSIMESLKPSDVVGPIFDTINTEERGDFVQFSVIDNIPSAIPPFDG